MDWEKLFEEYADTDVKDIPQEHLISSRKDVCAVVFLDKLIKNGKSYLFDSSNWDVVFFDVSGEDMESSGVTAEDVRILCALGVEWDSEWECLKYST